MGVPAPANGLRVPTKMSPDMIERWETFFENINHREAAMYGLKNGDQVELNGRWLTVRIKGTR